MKLNIENVEQLKQYYQQHPMEVLQHQNMGICICSHDGQIIYHNHRFAEIYTLESQQLLHKRIQEICSYCASQQNYFSQLFAQNKSIPIQEVYINGGYFIYKLKRIIHDEYPFMVLTLLDITVYKRQILSTQAQNKQLEKKCYLDKHTGLNYGELFVYHIEQLTQQFSQYTAQYTTSQSNINDQDIAIILLDIDKFEIYNQQHGYMQGDIVLKKISQCLSDMAQSSQDSLYYLGGDEFIFMISVKNYWQMITFAEQVLAKIQALHIIFDTQTIYSQQPLLTVSLSMAHYHEQQLFNADFFLVDLKQKMKIAKQQGGNRWIA